MSHPEGEGPSDPHASKAHADKVLKDPKHHAEKGSWKDLETVDDAVTTGPAKEVPTDE